MLVLAFYSTIEMSDIPYRALQRLLLALQSELSVIGMRVRRFRFRNSEASALHSCRVTALIRDGTTTIMQVHPSAHAAATAATDAPAHTETV